MAKKAWQSNTGDNVKQAGIETHGVGDNSTVTQSISEENSWSAAYTDSHNDSHNDSHDVATHVRVDSHNVANTAISNSYHNASSDSHNSYTNIDSHDNYSTTNTDSHDVTNNVQNIHASFTSTGQAMAFGVFFGGKADVVIALVAVVAALVAIFAAEIMEAILIIGMVALAIGGIAATGIVSHMAVQAVSDKLYARKVRLFEQQQVHEERQLLLEQREHEVRIAEAQRPVYVTVAQPAQLADKSSVRLIEDSYVEAIEPVSEKIYVRRKNSRNI